MKQTVPSHERLDCKIRPAEPKDLSFIGNSLSRSYAIQCEGPESGLPAVQCKRLIRRRLAWGYTITEKHRLDVAVDPDNDDTILGYSWTGDGTLYYVYARELFRGQGIALQLLAPLASHSTIICPHWTRDFSKFAEGHPIYRRI